MAGRRNQQTVGIAHRHNYTMSNWTKLLQYSRAEGAEVIPKGFKSRIELQEQFSLGTRQTDMVVQKLLASGKIERRNFKVLTRAGIRSVPHYKIK